MRKRMTAAAAALTLIFAMLTGCGGTSKNDYLNDVEEFATLNNADISSDPEEMADDISAALKDLKLKTPEGKAVKEDMEQLIDLLDKITKNMDDLDEDIYNDMLEIYENIEKDMEDFVNAAEEAGVDEDDVEALNFQL